MVQSIRYRSKYHHPRTHNPISAPLFGQLQELGVQGLKDSSGVWPGPYPVRLTQVRPRLEEKPCSQDRSNVYTSTSHAGQSYPRLALRVLKGHRITANRYLM